MLWAKLVVIIFWFIGMICAILATKYTYLYAKEEGYEHDWTPFFMFSAYGKYRNKAFKKAEKDSHYRKMTRLYNIYVVICFVAMFVVDCILKLFGFL